MCLTAMGFDARFVWDQTDHVWTEVYSEHMKRWVHTDSCENAWDSPMMYESGWGKKLTYVFGFAHDHVADVTLRYTKKVPEVYSRRSTVSEVWLKQTIELINMQLDIWKTPEQITKHTERMKEEQAELIALQLQGTDLKPEELQGRISGSQEWREQRGEIGTKSANNQAAKSSFEPLKLQAQSLEQNMTPVFTFQNFAQSPDIATVGHASIKEGAVQLTANSTDQVGAVWHQTPVVLSSIFCTVFQFRITAAGQPADGFSLCFQRESAQVIGSGGGNLGFTGLKNAFAIEFDIYQGVDKFQDPDANHVAAFASTTNYPIINSHHSNAIACTSNMAVRLADGKTHTVKVLGIDKQLFVFIDDMKTPVLSFERPTILQSGEAFFVGFTGSTGGLCAQQLVQSWAMFTYAAHFPNTDKSKFQGCNAAGIVKKIEEFNAKQAAKLNEHELQLVKNLINSETAPFGDEQKKLLLKLWQWDVSTFFPVLDMARVLALRPNVAKFFKEQNDQKNPLLIHALHKLMTSDAPLVANEMLFYRLVSNMFEHNEAIMPEYQDAIMNFVLKQTEKERKDSTSNLKVAFASVFFNYSILFYKQMCTSEDARLQIFSAIIELAKREVASASCDQGTLYYLLIALGNMLESTQENDLIELLQAFDFEQEVIAIMEQKKQAFEKRNLDLTTSLKKKLSK